MKRFLYGVFYLVLSVVFYMSGSLQAFAYEPGLLYGKTFDGDGTTRELKNITDNDETTSTRIYYHVSYIFPSPVNLSAIYYNVFDEGKRVPTGSSISFFREDGTLILKINLSSVSNKVQIPVEIHQVKKIVYTNGDGFFDYISDFEVYQLKEPPLDVSITSFVAFHDKVRLYFSGNKVTTFDVYRDDELVGTTNNSSYDVTGLNPLTSYKFHILGKNSFGSLTSSQIRVKTTDIPPPPTFTSFRVSDVLDKSVRLSFSFLNANRYEVYRDGSLIAELPANSNSYLVNTDPSTTYQFWVVAVNEYGRTASNVLDVTTQELLVPPSDSSLSVAGVYMDRVDLKVSVKRARTIKFYRDNRLVNTIAGDVKTYTDNTVDADREYVYKFLAENEVGNVVSNELKVKTLKPPVTDVPIIYISPSSKTFLDSLTFMLSSNDPDASLFYSFNGSDWFPYSSPVKISKTSDVYAKAVNVLGVESSVVVNRYVQRESPKVQLGVDLQDVVDAGGSHFNFLWPMVAFVAGLIFALLYSKKFRDLF